MKSGRTERVDGAGEDGFRGLMEQERMDLFALPFRAISKWK